MKGLISLILIGSSLLAAADPGFYYPQTPGVPAPVKKAADSIYRVVARAGSAGELKKKDYQAYQEAFEKADSKALAQFGISSHVLAPLYLAIHETHRDDASYQIPNFSVGAGFFVRAPKGPGLRLIIPRHFFVTKETFPSVFLNAKTLQEADRAITDWVPQFMVVDKMGRTLYGRLDGLFGNPEPDVKVHFHGHSTAGRTLPKLAALKDEEAEITVDLMSLELPDIEGVVPLELAAQAAAPKEQIFTVGFPFATRDRLATYGVPDADGLSQRISTGVILDPNRNKKYTDFLATRMDGGMVSSFLERLLFHNADTVTGVSGAPILNTQGEVVGVTNKVVHAPDVAPEVKFTLSRAYGPNLKQLRWILEQEK